MQIKEIITGVYQITLGMTNVFILEIENGLVLIDTVSPGNAQDIQDAI